MIPNKERLRLLVTALRSGEYEQGRNRLTTVASDGKEKHCCLGVGCRIAMQHGVQVREVVQHEVGEGDVISYETAQDASTQVFPIEVAEWYGFVLRGATDANGEPYMDTNPTFEDIPMNLKGEHTSFAGMNDDGFSFVQIADMVEWYYGLNRPDAEAA